MNQLPKILEQHIQKEEKAKAEERKRILDAPSTSTGITSNGKNIMFRINRLPDSDDELSTPEVNGFSNNNNNNNRYSKSLTSDDDDNIDEDDNNHNNSSMNDDYVCSSRSNSRLSSSYQDEVSSTSSEEDFTRQHETTEDLSNTNGIGIKVNKNGVSSILDEITPIKANNSGSNAQGPTPDSGIVATPGCSSSSLQKSENKNGFPEGTHTGYSQIRFMQKLSRVKKNHREFEESDSD